MKYLVTAFLFGTSFLQAQDCACIDQMKWLMNTFEENDAGFQFVIDQKGMDSYNTHNAEFSRKAIDAKNATECHGLLLDWTRFFRNGHLGIQYNGANNQASDEQPEESDDQIRQKYKNEKKYDVDIDKFKEYVKKDVTGPTFEGIWKSGSYLVGVQKSRTEKGKFVGFILEGDNVYWVQNQIKFTIDTGETSDEMKANYYMRDHSLRSFDKAELVGPNMLTMGFVTWHRVSPNFDEDPSVSRYVQLNDGSSPSIQTIDSKTLLLRIPDFNYNHKSDIDSILAANHERIVSHPRLIVDVRNNGGGSDASYDGIINYLYTNPIKVIGLEYLSTPLNNARMNQFMNDPDWSQEDKNWAKESLEMLNKHIGEFVNVDGEIVSIEKKDTVYRYPEKVGILINQNCGSTTEQFILAAKQSQKVKLFGTTTTGVLDISNMHSAPFPCGEFTLWYSLTRSMRIPDYAIDNVGLQPDYFIHSSIKKYNWIDFVLDIWQ